MLRWLIKLEPINNKSLGNLFLSQKDCSAFSDVTFEKQVVLPFKNRGEDVYVKPAQFQKL